MEVSSHLRICIVDDNSRLRAGLRRLLDREEDMSVIAEAESIADALSVSEDGRSNMYIVDLGLGDDSGFDLIRQLRLRVPDACLVVLSWHNEAAYRRRAMELGAHAYVAKSDPPTSLISTLRDVCEARSAAMK